VAHRAEIEAELERALAELESGVRALTPTDLVRPCTDSETPGAPAWSAKDHVAHLIRIERAFLGIATRATGGDPDPISFSSLGADQDAIRAAIHRENQRHVEELSSRSLDRLLDELRAARADTLAFLAAQDDAVLASPIPGSPWGDGTIGGVLGRNADHQRNHMRLFQEGLGLTT